MRSDGTRTVMRRSAARACTGITTPIAFASQYSEVRQGWEPIIRTQSRVGAAVRKIFAEHPGRDVVLVGHGAAWTLLAAALTGTEPDLERWRTLAMPDVITVEKTTLLEPVPGAAAERG